LAAGATLVLTGGVGALGARGFDGRATMAFLALAAAFLALAAVVLVATARDGLRAADDCLDGFRAVTLARFRPAEVARRVAACFEAAAFLAPAVDLPRARTAAARARVRGLAALAPRTGFRLIAVAGFRLAIAASFQWAGPSAASQP
jgi:hypothetical protein